MITKFKSNLLLTIVKVERRELIRNKTMKTIWIAFLLTMGVTVLFLNSGYANEDIGVGETIAPPNSGTGYTGSRAPGTLTTQFNSSVGATGNMFDINPKVDFEITAVDINATSTGATAMVEVYYRPGTCVGYETSPVGWTLLATGSGTIVGMNQPTFIDLSGNGVIFNSGQTYGIYVHLESYSTGQVCWYTSGGPFVYSNSDLELTTHCGKQYPAFTGYTYIYRGWNGTLYYNTVSGGNLTASTDEIDHLTGGIVDFTLYPGSSYDTKTYLILVSASGTVPGINLNGGANLPINWDVMTNLGITLINTPVFDKFMGVITTGGAKASFVTTPMPATVVGLKLSFAYAIKAKPWFGSDYVTVTIK